MKKSIKMSDVTMRDWPDFIVKYELVDEISLKLSPGSILFFSYQKNPQFDDIHCDIFPQFKNPNDNSKLIAPFELVPTKGSAEMWIVSDKNRQNHLNNLVEGKNCFLFFGTKLVAKCTVSKIHFESKYL